MTKCKICGNVGGMSFECIDCCVKWLAKMDRATMTANAPVIEKVMGTEYLNKVREAFRAKK